MAFRVRLWELAGVKAESRGWKATFFLNAWPLNVNDSFQS